MRDFSDRIKNRKILKKDLPNLLQKINERTLTLIIADYLIEHPTAQNTLLTNSMLALFKEESKAAKYLNGIMTVSYTHLRRHCPCALHSFSPHRLLHKRHHILLLSLIHISPPYLT